MSDYTSGTFLVTGASGRTGSAVVRSLAVQGGRVRAMVRPSSPRERLPERGIEVLLGDYAEPTSLERACRGVDWVIATVGIRGFQEGAAFVRKVEYEGVANLVDAAAATGVKHMTLVTALDVDRAPLNVLYRAKHDAELYLMSSPLAYTILRPGGIVEPSGSFLRRTVERIYKGEPLRANGSPGRRGTYIFTDELAEYCIRAHALPESKNKVFEIGGPVSLSDGEYYALLGKLVGREPVVQYPPADELTARRRAVKDLESPEGILATFQEMGALSYFTTDMGVVGQVFGIQQRRLPDYLTQVVPKIVAEIKTTD